MPDYRAIAAQDARRYGLDPTIFGNQITQESDFNPSARSGAGAEGIAQFMPGTAAGYHVNPMDPVAALDAAARMDRDNLRRYGSYARMLSAYNSGRPDAYLDPHFASGQTFNYVKNILRGRNPGPQGSTAVATGVKAMSPQAPVSAGPSAQTNALLTALKMNGMDPTVVQLLRTRLGGSSSSLGPATPTLAGHPGRSSSLGTPGAAAPRVNGRLQITGDAQGLNPGFWAKVQNAVLAGGATALRINSGYRSPEHNREVGGAPNSNHMSGHALDGDVLVSGKWIPIGTFLQATAPHFGLRSGATFQWGGGPDVVHVDDGFNQH